MAPFSIKETKGGRSKSERINQLAGYFLNHHSSQHYKDFTNMTEFIPSPMLHRQFGTPFDSGTSGEMKTNKRGRSSIDEFEECTFEEDEVGYGEIDQSGHLDFNPEKRIRNNSSSNCGVQVEDRNAEFVNPEKRSRISSIRQPNFSSHAGFSFNDSSATIMRLEGELRNER